MTRTIIIAALLASAIACGGSDSSSTPTAPTTSSGQFTQTDLVVGTGAVAIIGSRITVSYVGWLYDTTKPSSKGNSFDANNLSFTLGANNLIAGWDRGIPGMRVGGQRRLILPPDLAYGSGTPDPSKIPPNATLVFDITLLSIQ
jgi:FKBP-type peptidyl-prolyl cis-trans isomerase FkpA